MRGKLPAARSGKLVISIWVIAIFAISVLGIYLISSGRILQPASLFQIDLNAKRPDNLQGPGTRAGANSRVVYPSSTHICMNGCNPHQNWIQFYLPSGTYIRDSFRLRTTLFLGQPLTFGISSTPCFHQDIAGYTCVVMQLSHRMLSTLTRFNLIPLSQLRDTNNWWLEYTPKH
jgi:hypothetical protein